MPELSGERQRPSQMTRPSAWPCVSGSRRPASLAVEPGIRLQDAAKVALADQVLGTDLLQCYAVNLVELRTHSPRCVSEPSDRRQASPLARLLMSHSRSALSLLHSHRHCRFLRAGVGIYLQV